MYSVAREDTYSYCRLDPIILSSSEMTISFLPSSTPQFLFDSGDGAMSCVDDVRNRKQIVGLGFGGEPSSSSDDDEQLSRGSSIKSRESIHVGGLCSSKARVRHHEPGLTPDRFGVSADAIENERDHIRP